MAAACGLSAHISEHPGNRVAGVRKGPGCWAWASCGSSLKPRDMGRCAWQGKARSRHWPYLGEAGI